MRSQSWLKVSYKTQIECEFDAVSDSLPNFSYGLTLANVQMNKFFYDLSLILAVVECNNSLIKDLDKSQQIPDELN